MPWTVTEFSTLIAIYRSKLPSTLPILTNRLIVANFVNFFASARATRIYVHHRLTGTPLVWDKTTHSYPFKLEPITPFNPKDQFARAMPPSRDRKSAAG